MSFEVSAKSMSGKEFLKMWSEKILECEDEADLLNVVVSVWATIYGSKDQRARKAMDEIWSKSHDDLVAYLAKREGSEAYIIRDDE